MTKAYYQVEQGGRTFATKKAAVAYAKLVKRATGRSVAILLIQPSGEYATLCII